MLSRRWVLPVVLLAAAGCTQGSSAVSVPAIDKSRAPALPKIRHVVIIFQENRSTDNLFNGLPGADTVRVGLTTGGGHVRLKPVGLTEPYDLDHAHSGFVTEYADGKLDGFNRENSNCI